MPAWRSCAAANCRWSRTARSLGLAITASTAASSGDRPLRISKSIGLRSGCLISFACTRTVSMLGGASLAATIVCSRGNRSYSAHPCIKNRSTPKQDHKHAFAAESTGFPKRPTLRRFVPGVRLRRAPKGGRPDRSKLFFRKTAILLSEQTNPI